MNNILLSVIKIALSSLVSTAVGALIISVIIHIWPNSTGRISFSLWLSVFAVALVGVSVIGSISLCVFKSLIGSIVSPAKFFWIAGCFGAILYFLINLVIAFLLPESAVISFFNSNAYLFPLGVGFVFGSLFGFFYSLFNFIMNEKFNSIGQKRSGM